MKHVETGVQRYEKNKLSGNHDHEHSVLDKLLDINKDYAVLMAFDMLMAGIDTVKLYITQQFYLFFLSNSSFPFSLPIFPLYFLPILLYTPSILSSSRSTSPCPITHRPSVMKRTKTKMSSPFRHFPILTAIKTTLKTYIFSYTIIIVLFTIKKY